MVEEAGGDEKDRSGCCRCIDGAKHRSCKERCCDRIAGNESIVLITGEQFGYV